MLWFKLLHLFTGNSYKIREISGPMKHFMVIAVLSILVAGCSNPGWKIPEKPNILVSILPQKTFIRKISGDDFNVSVLLPPGASPAAFSILPSQMAIISTSSAWFRIGYIGFELSWSGKIMETNPGMKVIDLSEGLDIISAHPAGKTGIDPHTWLSPENVRKMALHIRNELIMINPGKVEQYNDGYRQFLKEIDQTQEEIETILHEFRGRKLVSFHPSLSYFARDFGLIQLSLEQGGKEPTPAHLASIVETAKAEGIRVIFIQSEFDMEQARAFAEETGCRIVQVEPLNPDWSSNMITMAHLIRENF
jgi:zinc transport system substrate-binding protein